MRPFARLALSSLLLAAFAWAEEVPREEWLPVWMSTSRSAATALARLRNFTCLQDIQQASADGRGRMLFDFLQLEAGVIDGREAFGWPGGSLDADSPGKLGSFGVFSSGDFYAHLKSIVVDREGMVVSVTRVPEKSEWDFHISVGKLVSTFAFSGSGATTTVPYRAIVRLDPATSTIRRLAIEVPEVPRSFRAKSARIVLEYDAQRMGTYGALPARSIARIAMRTVPASLVETRWHGCIGFTVESRLIESDTPDPQQAPQAPAPVTSRWATVRTRQIHTRLDATPRIADGESVPLVLTRPLKTSDGGTLAAGVIIGARIVGLASAPESNGKVVALRLESLVEPGTRVVLRGRAYAIKGPLRKFRRPLKPDLTGLSGPNWADDPFSLIGNDSDALLLVDSTADRLRPPLTIAWDTLTK